MRSRQIALRVKHASRYLSWIPLGVLSLLAIAPSPAAATTPPGPRLATVELIETKGSERDENASAPFMSLSTFGPEGHKVRHLVKARFEGGPRLVPFPFFGPTWTGDGSALAIVAAKGKSTSYFGIGADGTGVQRLPGVLAPVFSTDGRWMAFARSRNSERRPGKPDGGEYSSTTTWLWNLETRELRRVTRWRDGLHNLPTSLSADGSLLAMTREVEAAEGSTLVLAHLDGRAPATFIEQASEAAISPDGSRVAFSGYLNATRVEAEENRDYDIGELYVANVDGSGVTRLTQNHTGIESSPSWDPSGERIAYVQTLADTSFVPSLGLLFPVGNQIRVMNADGGCKETIRRSPKIALYGVAWQPGPDRGAGPILCSPISGGRLRGAEKGS
jgi:Tol biopolymer transport system component